MAKLFCTKIEGHPYYPDHGSCVFAYFDGEPSEDELHAVILRHGNEDVTLERHDDEVSKRAGLTRWCLLDAS